MCLPIFLHFFIKCVILVSLASRALYLIYIWIILGFIFPLNIINISVITVQQSCFVMFSVGLFKCLVTHNLFFVLLRINSCILWIEYGFIGPAVSIKRISLDRHLNWQIRLSVSLFYRGLSGIWTSLSIIISYFFEFLVVYAHWSVSVSVIFNW